MFYSLVAARFLYLSVLRYQLDIPLNIFQKTCTSNNFEAANTTYVVHSIFITIFSNLGYFVDFVITYFCSKQLISYSLV